jgi:serralysin
MTSLTSDALSGKILQDDEFDPLLNPGLVMDLTAISFAEQASTPDTPIEGQNTAPIQPNVQLAAAQPPSGAAPRNNQQNGASVLAGMGALTETALEASIAGNQDDAPISTDQFADLDQDIISLIGKYQWSNPEITYSFGNNFDTDYESNYAYVVHTVSSSVPADTGSHNENHEKFKASFQSFNSAQRDAAKAWFNGKNGFDKFANITLQESLNPSLGTIRMGIANLPEAVPFHTEEAAPSGWQAQTYTISSYLKQNNPNHPNREKEAGDVWIKKGGQADISSPEIGSYAYFTYGHEIGHALGLKHPHEGNPIMSAAHNAWEFTIMSYNSSPTSGGPYSNTGEQPQSLMMYDIRALQAMYGASFSLNSSNTTYTFSKTTGEMFVKDGSQVNPIGQGTPFANRIFRTIWDGNGVDTYDFNNYTTKLSIDLSPGKWSDLDVGGTAQKAWLDNRGTSPFLNYAQGHVYNALQIGSDLRSLIENAVGGSNDDKIYGNIVGNSLQGNAGNDSIYGFEGNDYIDGGQGNDSLIGGGTPSGSDGANLIFGGDGNDVIVGGNGDDFLYGEAGNDTIAGGIGNDNINGEDGNDILSGNGGISTLEGGAGDDWLVPDDWGSVPTGNGNSTLVGGSGNDVYFLSRPGHTIMDTAGLDSVVTSVDTTLSANIENLYIGTSYDYLTPIPLPFLFNITATGNSLNNLIQGDAGNNRLLGLDGNDRLLGGDGRDTLVGGLGDDYLDGGIEGGNALTGGEGKDTFVLHKSKPDRITDFYPNPHIPFIGGPYDKEFLQVSAKEFSSGLKSGAFLPDYRFTQGVQATTAEHRFIFNTASQSLFFDSDGSGIGGAIEIAQFSNLNRNLVASDIYVT